MRESGIFFGGLLVGVLLSAAFGLELFPAARHDTLTAGGAVEGPPPPSEDLLLSARTEAERLLLELGETRSALEACRRGLSGGAVSPGEVGEPAPHPAIAAGPASPQIEGSQPALPGAGPPRSSDEKLAGELKEALLDFAWPRVAAIVERLLVLGEAGHALLLEGVRAAIRAGASMGEAGLPYPLLRVAAQHEREVGELISFALASPAMSEPAFAGLLYRLAPRFAAALPDGAPSPRPALVQRFLAALEEGPATGTLWWVLEGLSTLGVEAGVESLGRILADTQAAAHHGPVILHLGRMQSPEAALALEAFVERAGDAPGPSVGAALRALARMEVPEAGEALKRCLASRRRELKEAAHLAYFSRRRAADDLEVAARFLDSDATPEVKRRVVALFRERSPEILAALQAGSIALQTGSARAIIAREPSVPGAERDPPAAGGASGGEKAEAKAPPKPLEPARQKAKAKPVPSEG